MYQFGWATSDEFKDMQSKGLFSYMFSAICKMEKYNHTTKLTTGELLRQLQLRAKMLHMIDISNPLVERYFETWDCMTHSDSIIIQEPDYSDIMINVGAMLESRDIPMEWQQCSNNTGGADATDAGTECNTPTEPEPTAINLTHSHSSIRPLSVACIRQMAAIVRKNEFSDQDDFSARYIYAPYAEIFSDTYKELHGRFIALSIELSEHTNKEILDELSKSLDIWREETNTPSKPEPSKASNANLRKIINNKYILLLDGMIFNRLVNGAISDELLIKHIYPHLDIQPDSFRKTYKRNARAFASPQYLTAWEKTLTNLGLWDQPVQQALQKNF